MVLNLKCLLSVLIPSRKHPISPSRNHRVGHLSHETTARFCKACPWKEPGFNVPADARMGWLSFLGARWVDSLGFGRQISLVLILWLNFFFEETWRGRKTLPEKWLGQLFSGLARSMANCRIVLFLLLNAFGNLPTNACPGTQCTGDCLKAFASDLSFCHSKIYDYPRINIWLLKLHSTDTDLPGCYVATSTIPTATQEGSKFASRSMAWGVQFHRVRMVASTLKHSNSLPNKKPGKHLLHVEELRIHGLFMTYDSLLKQWWDSWERSLVHITVGETKTQKLNETQLGETHDISINRFHPI